MTFLYFIITTFSLCYLAADARIFGADTTAWNDIYGSDDSASDDDKRWLWGLGILKLRQNLLPSDFIREHLSCYFCMGIWAGPLAHWLLWNLYTVQGNVAAYCLYHPGTTFGWALGFTHAFLWGACGSYVLNAVLHRIETTDG